MMAADRMRALAAKLVDLREGEGRPALQAFLSLFGIAPLPEMVGSPLFAGGR